jgi:hypothetical protein
MLETPAAALVAVERVIALAIALSTLETWRMRHAAADDGVWRWEWVRRELAVFPRPVRALLDATLRYPRFLVLLGLRLVAAVTLLVPPAAAVPGVALAALVVLLVSTLLLALRWRGSVNGGSDFMTLVVLSALTVAAAFPARPLVALGATWYVAIQACNSYFVAGVVKLKSAAWRQGRALPVFLAGAVHDAPRLRAAFERRPALARVASYAVMLLECSFPLALWRPEACVALCALALAFHVGNVYVFGLNRFLWAWAATYPALYYCSQAHFR